MKPKVVILLFIFSIWLIAGCASVSTPITDSIPTVAPLVETDTVSAPVSPHLHNTAPDFTLSDTNGNTYELWNLRGYPVLINFWATWCGPCKQEMPALQAIFNEYSSSDLVILAINGYGESISDVTQYGKINGLNIPLLIDNNKNTSNSFQVQIFPTTFFIDRNSVIQYIQYGSLDQKGFENLLESTILKFNASSQSPASTSNDNNPTINLLGNIWSVNITEAHKYDVSSVSENSFSNFVIQTDVEITNNAHEYHGLMFRQQDNRNFYSFRITPDGNFQFDVWHTGDYSFDTILGPTQSDSINHGSGQINTLKVIANNDNFALYINGQYVGSVSDSRFQSGKVGVLSCTCDGSSTTSATFSNFSLISQP
jgi:thiol-disulfide isomerase/thioredoxin